MNDNAQNPIVNLARVFNMLVRNASDTVSLLDDELDKSTVIAIVNCNIIITSQGNKVLVQCEPVPYVDGEPISHEQGIAIFKDELARSLECIRTELVAKTDEMAESGVDVFQKAGE